MIMVFMTKMKTIMIEITLIMMMGRIYNDHDNGSDDDDHQSSLKNKVVISLAYIMCPNNPFRALLTFFGLMVFLTIPIIMNN